MRGAALGVKVEDDVHCAYARASYSAMYHRAPRAHAHWLRQLHRERRALAGAVLEATLNPRWGRLLGWVPTSPFVPVQACAASSPRCPSCCTCRTTPSCRCA